MTLSEHPNLPPAIARPLWQAAFSVTLFLAGLAYWSIHAPLATTIRLSGSIVSSAASVEIQHPYGGQIAQISFGLHDDIQKGDALLALDTQLDRDNLATYRAMHRRLMAENKVITALLTDRVHRLSDKERSLGQHHILRQQQALAQSALKRSAADNLALQVAAIERKLDQNQAQVAQLRARSQRQDGLLQRGIMARDNAEALHERIMIVTGEVAGEEAHRISLLDQQSQQQKQAELILLSMREELTRTREQNDKQMHELSLKIAQLSDVIEKATVFAPISGIVTEVPFQAQGMYAGRGQTLLSLAQPLQEPYLKFSIPTHQIDQLRPGMTGRFTLLAVNQRSLPRLDVTISAISPRAQTDENDMPQSYVGRAEIAPDSFTRLRKAMGANFDLSEDMPVELLIEGRKVSPAQYIFDPLRAAFDRAVQD